MSISAFLPRPSAPDAPASPPVTDEAAPKKVWFARLWPWALASLIVLGFVGVVTWHIIAPHPNVWTDNAYVRVHYAAIAPRVPGQVTGVRVENNDVVKAGQVLIELDDRDYQVAVASAEANLARDRAAVENAAASIVRQGPLIEQAKALVKTAEAQLSFSEADAKRYDYLATTGSGSIKTQQQADSSLHQSRASLDGAKAALEAAQAQLKILQTQEASANASVRASEAQLEQARLNLSYTTIRAPVDGMVAQRGVQVGNYVSSGTGLMAVVPLSEVYVEANYREVELKHVQAGQRARIHVDAYDIDLEGTVVGVPAATGATFATIQPNNATGNFTKIVQRLPVQIVIAPNQPLARLLRVGLSVETTIETQLADIVGQHRDAAQPAVARLLSPR
ncbi:HlyD family secretion protein [Methylobacterium nodulans]|uniref:Secretion protein HlyD family protein n=1 Tax=Methylobacterium nodulans (strain LMG 21967 / CNCM I-2342 / ORS 2060) TaxID=460265 RepID=B8IC35_METNO|nr:HlyD family secretion protein [Methylobacterium nodulans]ACL61217.1 secretion protein HlyD family protein [Methylobacterium nodulans ORS 2060]